MASDDSPDLHRYWIEFQISDSERPVRTRGTLGVDGGSNVYRFFGRGVGVTGYDLDDCLNMLRETYGADLPPVARVLTDPDLSGSDWDSLLAASGSPVWRSIWFPLVGDRPRSLP